MKQKFYKKHYKFQFGKHRGKTVEQVMHMDPGYLVWAHETPNVIKLEEHLYKEAKAKHKPKQPLDPIKAVFRKDVSLQEVVNQLITRKWNKQSAAELIDRYCKQEIAKRPMPSLWETVKSKFKIHNDKL